MTPMQGFALVALIFTAPAFAAPSPSATQRVLGDIVMQAALRGVEQKYGTEPCEIDPRNIRWKESNSGYEYRLNAYCIKPKSGTLQVDVSGWDTGQVNHLTQIGFRFLSS